MNKLTAYKTTMKNKLKKILEMAERGTKHEARVARAKLNTLLLENGMTIDELREEEKKRFYFTYKDAGEKEIIFGCFRRVTKIGRVTFYQVKKRKEIGFNMTPAEYIQTKEYIEAYQKAFRAEFNAMKERFVVAFLSKHHLFSGEDSEGGGKLSQDEINKIIAMMGALDDIDAPQIKITA